MKLQILVDVSICVTCVDLLVGMLSNTQDMYVCVHRSAIKCPHCRIVLRYVVNVLYLGNESTHYNKVWRRYAHIYSLYVCKCVFIFLRN
jgi:hypothetical protein